VELALALNLAFQPLEEIALELLNFTAAQAGHVEMIAVGSPLIIVLFALKMHQIKLVDQPVALEKAQRAVDGDAVNPGIEFAGLAEKLAGVQMGLGGLHDLENGASLAGHTEASRHQFGLKASRSFGLRQRHSEFQMKTSCN